MSEFLNFLKCDTTAAFTDGCVAHFGDRETEFETAQSARSKCPLLSFGVVCFAGTDAQGFLNGQFTTDCTNITADHAQFSAWCDPKGRVLFLFTLYRDGERYYAILPKVQVDNFVRRLKMYILRADVQVEDLSETVAIFGITGEPRPGEPGSSGLLQPWDTDHEPDSVAVIRHGPGRARFVIAGSDATAVARWTALDMPPVGEDAWAALDCFSGLPRLDERSSGRYLPQNLNLDSLNSLSFSKGCYPGQEIIARLKYRGEVKKRLMAATCAADVDIAPGSPIRIGSEDRTVGNVLYAKRVDHARAIVSAVVETGAATHTLTIKGAGDAALRRIDLPYAID